jgi:hypothetical protein
MYFLPLISYLLTSEMMKESLRYSMYFITVATLIELCRTVLKV